MAHKAEYTYCLLADPCTTGSFWARSQKGKRKESSRSPCEAIPPPQEVILKTFTVVFYLIVLFDLF